VALENVENAQRFNPVDPQLQQREAELATQIGDWPRVVRAYGEATRLNPEHYAPRVLLGRFYARLGETEAALASYQEALALNPLDEQIRREANRLEAEVEAR
jgi:tetratricopeptide (TPR) repeat protein